jgi:cytochrome P450
MTKLFNPLHLVTHASPYPHYQALREQGALRFDPELKLWIASNAAVVQAILESTSCAVRPPDDQVPMSIRTGNAGDVFGHLVRMNEGASHDTAKQVLQTSLRSIDFGLQQVKLMTQLRQLAGEFPLQSSAHMNLWQMALPVSLVAHLCGFADDALPHVVNWTRDFVACLSTLSTTEQIQTSHQAASKLQGSFVELLRTAPSRPQGFLASLQEEAAYLGWRNTDAIVGNLIGLLSQTYEATAGLIGNSLITLHTYPDLRRQLGTTPELISDFITEVARYDPPVQNTRRFVTQNITIDGQDLQAGDVILLLLAAANRDPLANTEPAQFLLKREDRLSFTFSHGRHQCPGQALAISIAATTVAYVVANSTTQQWQALQWHYRPSLNGRIPVFHEPS